MDCSRRLYAYGLSGKNSAHAAILGLDKLHPVFPIEEKNVCVMVSEIDLPYFQARIKNLFSELTKNRYQTQTQILSQEILQAHENVVVTLMQQATIVPFKFGTILKDEQAARQMLCDSKEVFKSLFVKFTGKAEWGVKVYADNQVFINYLAQIEPACQPLEAGNAPVSRGTTYLLQKKIEHEIKHKALAQLSEIAETIFHELSDGAYEAKVRTTLPQNLTGKKQEMVLNTVYLIEEAKTAQFCQQGKRLMDYYRSMGLDLEISGPWPPYSFTA